MKFVPPSDANEIIGEIGIAGVLRNESQRKWFAFFWGTSYTNKPFIKNFYHLNCSCLIA